jgi:hypothetical protein
MFALSHFLTFPLFHLRFPALSRPHRAAYTSPMACHPDDPHEPPPFPDPASRSLARGSGYVFQAVGLALLLGGCCLGPLVGYFQGEQDLDPHTFVDWLRYSPPGQLLTGINIIVSAMTGLALVVFGLGLHQERRGSGTGALIAAGALALNWWVTAIAAVLYAPSILRIAVSLLLAIGATLLFLLAGAARRELKLHPPPPDEPVTEEFLKQLERRRHRVEED